VKRVVITSSFAAVMDADKYILHFDLHWFLGAHGQEKSTRVWKPLPVIMLMSRKRLEPDNVGRSTDY
jgi:hypothetical protein